MGNSHEGIGNSKEVRGKSKQTSAFSAKRQAFNLQKNVIPSDLHPLICHSERPTTTKLSFRAKRFASPKKLSFRAKRGI